MSEFIKFNYEINKKFTDMQEKSVELFVVDIDKDVLWDIYLSSFNEDDNPIYLERTEHDCNCCKQFIRDVGGVVAIIDGELESIWAVDVGGIFQPVADALMDSVLASPIKNVYRHYQKKIGTAANYQLLENGDSHKWEHFNTELPNSVVLDHGVSVGEVKADTLANYDVLKRSLEEIDAESIEIVSDLIVQNSIYRGEEHKSIVTKLKELKWEYSNITQLCYKTIFLWETSAKMKQAGRIRNTVIGTLLCDISDGVDLEIAVKSFEAKVAPTNYKRSSALVTQKMIDNAEQTIVEHNMEDSLDRRYAVDTDITINNVLFADRSTKPKMKCGSVLGDIKPTKKASNKSFPKVEEIGIDDFIDNVLPTISSMEVFVENTKKSNLVSLIAPVHDYSRNILKWANNFTWSYNGEVTDSVKERVKKAGGVVDADVRASLSWFNYDDLDIHVKTKNDHIFYGHKRGKCGGHLDVDMNVGKTTTREAVENLYWKDKSKMTEAVYEVYVNNFTKRETVDVGFDLQFVFGDEVMNLSYPKALRNGESVHVLNFEYSKKKGISVIEQNVECSSTVSSEDVWNVSTENFHKVKMLMNSPNHWDNQTVGNKHWFFMLEGCYNPDTARGFYNEFLSESLNKHRKVFELLSAKMKTPESTDQLSGLGFSSTKRSELICKVSGSSNRTLKIKF